MDLMLSTSACLMTQVYLLVVTSCSHKYDTKLYHYIYDIYYLLFITYYLFIQSIITLYNLFFYSINIHINKFIIPELIPF